MELGFIGLGKMGRPMVARLLAAGHRVGFVGLEHRPAGSTDEGLDWIKAFGSPASA